MNERWERNLFLVYLFLIFLGELSFYLFFKQYVNIKEYTGRNPFYRKCWKEYINSLPPKKKGVLRVLFISNSQGFGKEFAPDEIISSWMERYLNKSGYTFEVLNLSIGGGQSPEFLFLLADSKKLKPDLIVFSLSPANFGKKVINKKLSDFVSDAPLELYGNVPVFFFGNYFTKKYIDVEFKLSSFFYKNFKSYPLSTLIIDELSMRFRKFKRFLNPTLQNKWIFSKRRRSIISRKKEEVIVLRRLLKKSEDIDKRMVDCFYNAIIKNGVPTIFFNQPVRSKGYFEYEKYFLKFNNLMQNLNSRNFKYFDFSRKLNDGYFVDNVHLTLKGHMCLGKKFSDVILKNIDFFKEDIEEFK